MMQTVKRPYQVEFTGVKALIDKVQISMALAGLFTHFSCQKWNVSAYTGPGYRLLLAVNGLMHKLFASGVAERRATDVAFTDSFGTYITRYASSNPVAIGTVSGWREMLGSFDGSLSFLTAEEISAIIVLLDLYLVSGGNATAKP